MHSIPSPQTPTIQSSSSQQIRKAHNSATSRPSMPCAPSPHASDMICHRLASMVITPL